MVLSIDDLFNRSTTVAHHTQRMSATGKGPFTTVNTSIPPSVAARSSSYSIAGEGDALFIVGEDLKLLGSPVVQKTVGVPW